MSATLDALKPTFETSTDNKITIVYSLIANPGSASRKARPRTS